MEIFLLFLLVGFAAQIVDGALGMAFGVISATMLLAFGVPPFQISAAVHASKLFTTAGSASATGSNTRTVARSGASARRCSPSCAACRGRR